MFAQTKHKKLNKIEICLFLLIMQLRHDSDETQPMISMKKRIKNNIKFDFIYIDGSHKCLDVMCDIIQAWELLDIGGILALDDVGWQPETYTDFDIPIKAVQLFADKYYKRFKVLDNGYRLFVEKIK